MSVATEPLSKAGVVKSVLVDVCTCSATIEVSPSSSVKSQRSTGFATATTRPPLGESCVGLSGASLHATVRDGLYCERFWALPHARAVASLDSMRSPYHAPPSLTACSSVVTLIVTGEPSVVPASVAAGDAPLSTPGLLAHVSRDAFQLDAIQRAVSVREPVAVPLRYSVSVALVMTAPSGAARLKKRYAY